MRYTLIAQKLIDVLYYIAGGFSMTNRLLIAFFIVFGFKIFAITHSECEALKSDINSRLDTIDYSVSSTLTYVNEIDDIILNSYTAKYSNTNPSDSGSLQSTSNTYYFDDSGNPLGTFGEIHTKLIGVRSDCQVITNTTSYIRGLLSSVSCDDSTNGCNCADQLAAISEQVDSIFGTLSLQYGTLQEINLFLDYFYSDFSTYSQEVLGNLSSISNSLFSWNNSRVSSSDFQNLIYSGSRFKTSQTGNNAFRSISTSTLGPFRNVSYFQSGTFSDIVRYGFLNSVASLISLNNYSYTNLYLSSSIHQLAFSINTNLVSANVKLSSISNSFSIFNDFVFSSDTPLSMYTDKQTDGSYHDYLTNYYIKVSKGQQSGSDNYTNWFSRVELLLAALVFQDEDDSTINTNGVPSESDKNSVAEIGSSLDQQISGFIQGGNSHVSSVDTSGKSIIRMVTSWNTAIGQTSKPAPFVVAEFTAPDSQSRSNISLYFDTEDEKLSSLIEIGHGISTLAWVAVFLLLGYNLAVYSIRVLRRLISFSFSLYSAIFGGG